MAHQFRAGTVDEYTEYIELWDVGSSLMHRRASSVFLEGASGVILVHDLTNRKSEENLCSQWLPMLNNDRNARLDSTIASMNESLAFQPIIDVESTALPSLVVGCKLDLAPDRSLTMSSFESINLDARKPLTPGTSGYLIIANFFDSVIKKTAAPSSFDRRRKHL
ncbi:hypothetical protein QR680_000373 [Steinernema hermaphroditum]|uniref:Uncharacterized protein n=1 Tax=Steinernema hermaphroditum TaxID=289476 RepID=A0AA39GV83_9BILA|nr:hypothetical protein QR680_000373 [Steinernema hermaphroditum]